MSIFNNSADLTQLHLSKMAYECCFKFLLIKCIIFVNFFSLQVVSDACVKSTNDSSTLIIPKVFPEDAGSYSLFVRNRGGTAHWTVNLRVIGETQKSHQNEPFAIPRAVLRKIF